MGRRKLSPAEEAAIAFGDEPESATKGEETLRVKSSAPSLVVEPSLAKTTAAESLAILASQVEELRGHLRTSGTSYVRACEVAADIFKSEHWRQKHADDGTLYRSWEDYARRSLAPSLGLKSAAIYSMIKIVAEGLVADVHAFGSTVARALASLPEARRPEVRALAEEGAPTDEIKERTTEILDEEHAKQTSDAADKGEAPRKRMGRPAGSGKSKRKREEESRKAATQTNEHALSELAVKGRSAFTFCFEGDDDGTIVDTFADWSETDVRTRNAKQEAKLAAAHVETGERVDNESNLFYLRFADRNGRRITVEMVEGDPSQWRVKFESDGGDE